tara:strand:+ start:653 stop:1369 length:717 start_codon:yes stop_codon:yes gene_type:complete
MNFKKKVVFVTGASRGIGKAIAKEFKKNSAYVIGTYTGNSKSKKLNCDEWYKFDFTKKEHILECKKLIIKIKPNILVNNAGINIKKSFENINEKDFLNIHQVNVLAPMMLCQSAIKVMKKNKWGRIINIASIWSKISKEQRGSYSASKFALDGLTLSIAAEYSKYNILANCISPGFINTDLTKQILSHSERKAISKTIPIKRMGESDEIAKFVLWLSSEQNTYISGQNIAIDGGFTRV